ncbi:MAG TPA: hypothetical protein DIV86_02955 [Alphaproteobacteria bacterium]|nr:hypothetical protein [Alphaproteobacteria bacterium]
MNLGTVNNTDDIPVFDDVITAYNNIREYFGESDRVYFNHLLPVSFGSGDLKDQTPVGVNEFQAISEIGSFKLFGAFNKICQVYKSTTNENRVVNVAASAGNHAQGVALACKKLGLESVIFMPVATPINKIIGTLRHGGQDVSGLEDLALTNPTRGQVKEYCDRNFDKWANVKVKIAGANFDETAKLAQEYTQKIGGNFIPPYNNKEVIAAAGTWGLRLIEDLLKHNFNSLNYEKQDNFVSIEALMTSSPDNWTNVVKEKIEKLYGEGGKDLSISLPVGGGGLAAGMSLVIRKFAPAAELIAVALEGTPSLIESAKEGSVVPTTPAGLKYDDGLYIPGGTKVAKIGDITFEVIKNNFDKAVLVEHKAFMEATANNLFREAMSEPQAGATQVAALNAATRSVRISVKSGENLSLEEIRIIREKFPTPAIGMVKIDGAILETVEIKRN